MSIESSPSHSTDQASPTAAETLDAYKDAGLDPNVDAYIDENNARAYSQERDTSEVTNPEQNVNSIEEVVDKPANTPEEVDASKTLHSSSELKEVARKETEDRLDLRDKAMNTKDRVMKKALMYDQRDSARQWKVVRLEAKLENSRARNPNSNRTRQLERKLNWQRMMLGNIRKKSGAIDSRMDNRGDRRKNIENAKENAKALRKKLQEAAKETEKERRRRWQVRKEAFTSKSETRKKQLRAEMRSWDKNTLAKFYQEKVNESVKRYESDENINNAIDRLEAAAANNNPVNSEINEEISNTVDKLKSAVDTTEHNPNVVE
ncbi:MAG: hypothetical protein H6797_05920 [Candidatus Nomurabacteria bacterium]|nr:MAG: hypothetical protein H6797_05920 [Candidatus Nomurabacteria bacterium]